MTTPVASDINELIVKLKEFPVLQDIVRAYDRPKDIVSTPASAVALFRSIRPDYEREELFLLCLDKRHQVVEVSRLTVGSHRLTVVDSAQIYRAALKHPKVAAIVLAHTHPSGDPSVSLQDKKVTYAVREAGQLLGIPLLDHIVITATEFTSMAEMGLCSTTGRPVEWCD